MQEIVAYDSQGNSLTNLVQWDSDVYVYLSGDEITSAHRVHFFNNTLDEALVVNSTYSNGTLKAKIPNSLLTQPYIIVGYVSITKNGETKSLYCFKINVRKKPMPSNYLYVDTKDWVDAEVILQECANYASAASTSATNAKTSETNAASSANASSTSEKNAKSSEQAAATSATKAKTSETNAKTSETNSSTNATNAAKSASDANTSAQKASVSEDNAADSASEAKKSATAAKESETNAANSKTAAAKSETNAKTSETNAAKSENNAKVSENAAAQSASDASDSAASANQSATNANASAIAAQKAKQDILDMTVSAETLDPGEEATVEYTTDSDGHISMEYGIPKGYDGYTPQRGVDYYTDDDVNDIVDAVVERIDPDGSGTQHVHTNKELLDSITDADKEKWDSDARPVRILEITIPAANWNDGVQTIENSKIDASDSYMYLISPKSDCEIAYGDAFVRAKDIDTNSEIVFTCQKTPTIDLTVRVLIFDAIND